MRSAIYAVAIGLLLLSGCAVKTKIQTPKARVPQQWSGPSTHGVEVESPAVREWWKTFQDATLDALVERAARENLDLRTAAARVTEARAARGISASALLPSAGTTAGYTRVRGGIAQGLNRAGIVPGSPTSRSSLLAPFETNIFQLGFDASWELDLFGGTRRAVEAATADMRAAEEGKHDVLVTVLAEIGRNYVEVRGNQKRLEITRNNIEAQQQTLDLTHVRSDACLATDLDVARAAAQLAATQAAIPSLESELARGIHRLGVLLGEEPGALRAELEKRAPLPTVPSSIPIGLPSDLLLRRPDVRRADAEIAAATARLGVARSELFPKFTLTGLAGRQSTGIGGLTLGAGNFFSFGPGVRLPIFTGGRIRSNIAMHDARLQQALTQYESSVLKSLEEVENALVAYSQEQQRRASLQRAVDESRRAVEMANELYLRGLEDFLSVLEAQKSRYTLEDELAQSETNVVVDLVALYKALGGGW
ncbi:MAG: efflux transporter outer membrane subunit [Acidobacteria bacterium]|nr:efflux transporter outer membrane subunit [Acidobacteriota bacterium]